MRKRGFVQVLALVVMLIAGANVPASGMERLANVLFTLAVFLAAWGARGVIVAVRQNRPRQEIFGWGTLMVFGIAAALTRVALHSVNSAILETVVLVLFVVASIGMSAVGKSLKGDTQR